MPDWLQMRSRLRGILLTVACLSVVVLVALLIISAVSHGYTPPPLPNPNGYAGIIKGAQTIKVNPPDFSQLNDQQLQAFVRSNSVALQLIRSNLSEPVQVPVVYSIDYSASAHLSELSKLKSAAYAFAAEAQLAQLQHRPVDAANSDLDIIRLGAKCSHGGLLIDGLVANAVENIGTSELRKLTGTLDGNTCKDAARQLEAIDAETDTWKQILRQEHYWGSKAFTSPGYLLARLLSFNSTRKSEARARQKFEIARKNTRTLMIDLAARAYSLEKGHPPNSMADLIPAYLKSVPIDPTTGLSMGLPASTQTSR